MRRIEVLDSVDYATLQSIYAIEEAYSKAAKEAYPEIYKYGVEVEAMTFSPIGVTYRLDNISICIKRTWEWVRGFDSIDYYHKKVEDLYRAAKTEYSK